MKKPIYIYPGTFSPPTFGHFHVVDQAAAVAKASGSRLIILCSINPNKSNVWFSPNECRELWQTYNLPAGVEVMTKDELQNINVAPDDIIIVRGLRDATDFEQEKNVMMLNKETSGIKRYLYIFGAYEDKRISSSLVREEVSNLDFQKLDQQVSGQVINALLEKIMVIEKK